MTRTRTDLRSLAAPAALVLVAAALIATPADAKKKGPTTAVAAYCSMLNEPLVSYAPCQGQESVHTVDDTTNYVGRYTSIAIGTDGNPIVSYHDDTDDDLKVAKCKDLACAHKPTITTVLSDGQVGLHTSIAVGVDGYPVISHFDATSGHLEVAKCSDPACSAPTNSTVDSGGGLYTSIAVGNDGHPVIAYYWSNDLRVVKCNDPGCVGGDETISVVDDQALNQVGLYASIAVGADGHPVVSYNDMTDGTLKVAKCNDPACDPGVNGTETITIVDDPSTPDAVGEFTAIAVGTDGKPVVAYFDRSNESLKVAKCHDHACALTATITTVDDPPDAAVGSETSIAIGRDGRPVISYIDYTNFTLKVARCNDPACADADETITTVDAPANNVGFHTSIAIGRDGDPVVSYLDGTAGALKVARVSQ